jgi:hypothetical protein
MNNPDQNIVLRAIEDARRIPREYIELGARDDAKLILERLIAVLDKDDLVHSLPRLGERASG